MFKQKAEAKAGSEPPASARILVVGGRGLDADMCVDWTDPIPNVADYDVAVVLAPTAEIARNVEGSAFRDYRDRFHYLMDTNGSMYVIAVPFEDWTTEGQPQFYRDRSNYEWSPVPVDVRGETGSQKKDVDRRFAWYFDPIQQWEALIAHPTDPDPGRQLGGKAYAVGYGLNPLARNRAGQALGTRLTYSLHARYGDYDQFVTNEPFLTSGAIHFLGLSRPWTSESAAAAVLANLFGRAGSSAIPAWITAAMYPPTQELDRRIEDIRGERTALDENLRVAEAERDREREAVGLLFESGTRLEDLVADAFNELEVALGESVAQEEYTALFDGVVAAVEVKGNSKSASQDDFRAIADYVAQHDMTDDYHGSRGILVLDAWRTTALADRPAWFPDNVQKAAASSGRISLVQTDDLYAALMLHRTGADEKVAEFMTRVFTESGLIRLGN